MNNELQIFTNEQLGDIRTIMQDGEPWFVAADVCKMFGVSNSRSVTSRLYDDEKGVSVVDTPRRKAEFNRSKRRRSLSLAFLHGAQ